MSFETILIECSRENSNNFKFDPSNELKSDNSRWTNNVNFELKIGDQVSIENAIIHNIGNSEGSTIEINGEENDAGFTDDKQAFEFLFYINNNGYNGLQLPYYGGMNTRKNSFNINKPIYDYSFDFIPYLGTTIYINVPTVNNVKTMPVRYGAPIMTNNYNFVYQHLDINIHDNASVQISYEDNIFSLYKQPLGLRNPNGSFIYDGEKYIVLSQDFKGYYRSNNYVDEENAEFDDPNDDLMPYTQKVGFNVDAGFTPPATLCNFINEALHETFEDTTEEEEVKNTNGEFVNNVFQGKTFPIVNCNGNIKDNTTRSPLWSQIAVKDFYKARGVYNMMRTSLAFDGLFRFDASQSEYFCNRPCILINGAVCRFKSYTGDIIETSMYPYKKVDYTLNLSYQQSQNTFDPPGNGTLNNKSSTTIFTVIPEGWLVQTNMEYTAENIKRLERYFKGNERYTGDKNNKNDAETDIKNWYVRLDLGGSRDGANSTETRPQTLNFDNIDPYVGHPADSRNLGVGRIQIDDIDDVIHDFDSGQIYNGSSVLNPFSVNINIGGMSQGTDGTKYRFVTSPRSQTPRYGQKMYSSSGYVQVTSTTLNHNFYNNEFEDCNLTIYSKFLSDYKSIIKQSNTNKPENDWNEGDGEYKFQVDLDLLDTSLTNDIGVYGCPISKYNMPHDIYELCLDGNPCYLQLQIHNYTTINGKVNTDLDQFLAYTFLYKIEVAENGEDQETHGGYLLKKWNNDIAVKAFETDTDIYIYSGLNDNYKAGQNIENMTYRQGKKIDFEKYDNLFLFYKSDNYAFVGEVEIDKEPFTKIVLYPIDGIQYPTTQPSSESLFYDYLYLSFGGKITITTRTGIGLYVQSTQPLVKSSAVALNPSLSTESGGAEEENDFYPFLATANTQKVCSFIVKYSSYNIDQNGNKTLDGNKHLLPSMYQSLFLCSPSFMDLPTIWLSNPMNTLSTNDYLSGGYAQQYMSIGAPNPTCQFNDALQKSTFTDFHNPRILGVSEMPQDGSGNIDTDTLGSVVTKFYGNNYPYYNLFDAVFITVTPDGAGDTKYSVNFNTETVTPIQKGQYSTSGIMIYKLYGGGVGNDDVNTFNEITTEEEFNNTLLYKLGFLYTDFFNDFGVQDALFNSSIRGKYDKSNRYRNVNFYTTNPVMDITTEPFLSVYASGGGSDLEGLPYYQLSYLPENVAHTIDANTSENIVSSNKPIKMNSAFYQIRSDLISTHYISNNENVKTIALGMKEYITNDFVYCNTNDYGLTVLTPMKISNITTELRLSNGKLAPSNQFNTVIYKIRRPIILEDLQEIIQNAEQEQKQEMKQLKK